MGKYGNIDGIATLTNDPLALDNISEYGCTVRFDDTEEVWIECNQLSKE